MLPVCGHEQKSSETTHLLVAREKGKETKRGEGSDPKIFSYVGVKKMLMGSFEAVLQYQLALINRIFVIFVSFLLTRKFCSMNLRAALLRET